MQFSDALVNTTKEYFRKQSGLKLSDTEANTYIEKLGALGMVVCDMLTASQASPPAASRQTMGLRGPMATQASGGQHSGGTELVAQSPQSAIDDSGDK